MKFWSIESGIKRVVESAVVRALEQTRGQINSLSSIDDLKRQISQLEIDRDKKKEEFDRREREVEHKVGLERKRQEFEIEQAKRETTVKVREENLAADKDRFKSEMDFQRKHLEGEIGSLRTLVGQLLERVPSAEIFADVSVKKR